jgi:hypothetical protein
VPAFEDQIVSMSWSRETTLVTGCPNAFRFGHEHVRPEERRVDVRCPRRVSDLEERDDRFCVHVDARCGLRARPAADAHRGPFPIPRVSVASVFSRMLAVFRCGNSLWRRRELNLDE